MTPLFKRNNKTTIAELEEYYANQRKRRNAKAWLMALLSLFITIVVIVLLFLAGRWIYNTFIDKDSQTSTTQNGSTTTNLPTFDSEDDTIGGDRGVDFEEGTSNDPDNLIVEENGSVDVGGTVTDEAASTEDSNADRVTANNIGSAGVTEMPNTGAGETTLAILVAVAILGYLVARKRQLSK